MRARSEAGAVVRIAVALLVAGVLLGLGWALLAPGLPVRLSSDGTVYLLAPEARSRFDATGFFAVGALVVGLVAGAASWLWRTWRGPVVLVGLTLAGAAAGAFALAVGTVVASARFPLADAAAGSSTQAPPELGSWTLGLLVPVGAVLVYTLAAALSRSDDPRGTVGGASSAPTGPAAAPGGSAPPARP